MAKQSKIKSNKKFWMISTIVLSVLLVITIVANVLGSIYAVTLNWFFGTTNSTSVAVGGDGEVYFKSDYAMKDASGEFVIEGGKQVYDSDSNAKLVKDGAELTKQVGKEGFVLIANNGALPLEKSSKVSLFGQSVDNIVISGTGSGGTGGGQSASYITSLKAGGLTVNEESYKFYSEGAGKDYRLNVPGMHDANPFRINECPWGNVSSDASFSKMIDCDAAVVVFSRNGGEGFDLSNGASDIGYDFGTINVADGLTKEQGSKTGNNYLELNADERGVLEGLNSLKQQGKIKNIVVVLNCSNAMQLDFLRNADYGVDACIWIGATGEAGVDALGPILSGDVNPSGHLIDTYCYDNLAEPSIYNFGQNEYTKWADYSAKSAAEDKYAWMSERYYNIYREGIYVGYRYHETRYEDMVLGNTTGYDYASTVAYAMGHGLSYSAFEYSGFTVRDNNDGTMTATVTVTNKSDIAGKEVVELYAQTPYTQYDKENKIEKASIELVGFEKTKLLAKGESQKIEVTFEKQLLAAYDAYGAKTYVMDAGDYYLTFGNGAHDALNNVLRAKGADESKMVEAAAPITFADDNAVYSWNQAEIDQTTYAKSTSTDATITNRFDNADLNLFENGLQSVTYVSRSDWNGTFDITSFETMKASRVAIKMTDAIYNGVKYDAFEEDAEAKKNAEMPKFGVENGLKLIQFRGVPMDGSITVGKKTYTWDDLLDQLSYKEIRELIVKGQHTTARVTSVAKPVTSDQNGPSGFATTFVGGGSGTAYPVPCVRAATWNKELVNEVGKMIGEDGLHSGCNGLYGPAANIHRNAYCGRNFEYYSEDPVVSALMCQSEVKGIQSKGIVVYLKHFAVNDSETHREGVANWLNEQAMREIYLEAFRDACKIDGGNTHAIMSGFNRLGTTWCGSHGGLLNEVLRGEWGFDGFVITDMDACDTTTHCTVYMYAPAAVCGGTDIYDGNDNGNHKRSDQLNAYKEDAYVVSCMRQAAARILYITVNSAAMNGIGAKTQIKSSLPVWQISIISACAAVGVLTMASGVLWILNVKEVVNFPYKKQEEGIQ